jgi:hypothetical protein
MQREPGDAVLPGPSSPASPKGTERAVDLDRSGLTAASSGDADGRRTTVKADGKADLQADLKASARKVINTGHVSLRVRAYGPAREVIEKLVAQAGGFVQSAQVRHHQGRVSSATLVLRVASASFGRVERGVHGLGEVLSESSSAEDVTEAYTDLAARLKNARRLESRFLEMLEKQAGGVADLLQVERELARVREQIELHEGRLRLLDHRVELGTLTVNLEIREQFQAGQPQGLGGQLGEVLSTSTAAVTTFLVGLLKVGVAVVPWAPLAMAAWLAGRALRRWRRVRRR